MLFKFFLSILLFSMILLSIGILSVLIMLADFKSYKYL